MGILNVKEPKEGNDSKNKLNSSAEALGMKNGAAYVYITHKTVPISKAVPALFIFRGCSNAIIK